VKLPPRFETLIRHFFGRFFDKDSISTEGYEHANVSQIIAMLALPGAIVSLFTMADHPLIRSEVTRLWLRSGDRYVFVCYSMVVMGFVMTFKWDSLFPDRRDYLILTPLPISLREFFAAKVISLCVFLFMFVIAINVFSGIIVPWVFAVRDNRWDVFLPALLAHATAVLSGAVFMALFFAALQGVLINLMTPATFRRVSTWVQMISMTTLMVVLLIIPGISANLRVLAESNTRALDYIPVFWFFGIYEVLNPEGTLIPASHLWATTAVEAMLLVSLLFVVTYLISYRRYSKKILEGIESDVFTPAFYRRASNWILNAVLLRHPFQRASFHFIGRIFERSSKHRLFIAMYGGIGLALTVSSLFVLRRDADLILAISRNGLIEAPLILSFFVVSGLRATFNIPYELDANWMFQITSGNGAAEFLKATRRWVLLRGIVPVYAVIAPMEFRYFEPTDAVFHLAFGLATAALLTELFFFNFNKVPFTCSYLPPRSHMAFLAGAYLYGFTMYAFTAASLERWLSLSAPRIVVFFITVLSILVCLGWYRRQDDFTLQIIYEDNADPVVRQLELT
jgi:hypothetical protein